jgi:hypothetical protein
LNNFRTRRMLPCPASTPTMGTDRTHEPLAFVLNRFCDGPPTHQSMSGCCPARSDVRVGSKAEVLAAYGEVRFAFNYGHHQPELQCDPAGDRRLSLLSLQVTPSERFTSVSNRYWSPKAIQSRQLPRSSRLGDLGTNPKKQTLTYGQPGCLPAH